MGSTVKMHAAAGLSSGERAAAACASFMGGVGTLAEIIREALEAHAANEARARDVWKQETLDAEEQRDRMSKAINAAWAALAKSQLRGPGAEAVFAILDRAAGRSPAAASALPCVCEGMMSCGACRSDPGDAARAENRRESELMECDHPRQWLESHEDGPDTCLACALAAMTAERDAARSEEREWEAMRQDRDEARADTKRREDAAALFYRRLCAELDLDATDEPGIDSIVEMVAALRVAAYRSDVLRKEASNLPHRCEEWGCDKRAAVELSDEGECEDCGRHLCAGHLDDHRCEPPPGFAATLAAVKATVTGLRATAGRRFDGLDAQGDEIKERVLALEEVARHVASEFERSTSGHLAATGRAIAGLVAPPNHSNRCRTLLGGGRCVYEFDHGGGCSPHHPDQAPARNMNAEEATAQAIAARLEALEAWRKREEENRECDK